MAIDFCGLKANRMHIEDMDPAIPEQAETLRALYKGFYLLRQLPDGRYVGLRQLTFGQTAIVISDPYDPSYFPHEWMYPNVGAGLVNFWLWEPGPDPLNPEPRGWFRHMPSRRRRPEGDPAREYTAE